MLGLTKCFWIHFPRIINSSNQVQSHTYTWPVRLLLVVLFPTRKWRATLRKSLRPFDTPNFVTVTGKLVYVTFHRWVRFELGNYTLYLTCHVWFGFRKPYSLLNLSNNTAVTEMLARARRRFKLLFKRRANLHHYLEWMETSQFDSAYDNISSVYHDYDEIT